MQPYSICPIVHGIVDEVHKLFSALHQNKSCSECQQDVRKIERQADRQMDRWTDRQKDRQEDIKTFQFSYENKSCSECQQDIRKQTDLQIDRKTESLFSLIVQDVNRMSDK